MGRDRDDYPRPAPDMVEDGVPATDEVPDHLLSTQDVSEGPVPPLDRPQGTNQWGTTRREERSGEPLGVRLDHEEADSEERGEDNVRQLFQEGAEGGVADVEGDEVGDVNAGWEDTLTAEEQAMRVDTEPGGLTDGDPGYVQED